MWNEVPTLCFDQDPEQTNAIDTKFGRGSPARALIHEHSGGTNFKSQGQCFAFASVQSRRLQ